MSISWRKIVVGTKTYRYRIGRQNVVIVDYQSKGEKGKVVVNFSRLTGWSWDTIERGIHKGYFSITPKQIANYIGVHLCGMLVENGDIVTCPKCKSARVEPVISFDYWKQCKDCKHEFMTGEHN